MTDYTKLIKALRSTSKWDIGNYPPLLMMRAADAIEELQSVVEHYAEVCVTEIPRWIPVTERLPEKYKEVLTYGRYGYLLDKYIGEFCGESPYFALAMCNVTHWMPLPAPPKDGDAT